jgi:hypothetical protein
VSLSPRRGWLAFFFVTFVLYNGCASHAEDRALSEAQRSGAWRWTPGNVVYAARTYGTDDGDILRYLAYCNAVLGLPYQNYYVRPRTDWMQSFAAKDGAAPESQAQFDDQHKHPDDFGVTTPAAPLVPYRDFLVEYPPGFFLVVLPPAWLVAKLAIPDRYPLLFSSLMALCLTFALVFARRMLPHLAWPDAWGARLVSLSTLAVLATGVVATRRCDAVISLLLCLMSWAFLADAIALCGAVLGLAIAVKGLPLLVLPLFAALLVRRRRTRGLAVLVATSTAVATVVCFPAVRAAGVRVLDAILYHFQRPLEVGSTPGAILGLIERFFSGAQESVRSFGSINLVSPLTAPFARASLLATGLGISAVYALFLRRAWRATSVAEENRELLRAITAVLVVFMVAGKVFSPQYLVWVLPLGLVLSLRARGDAWVLLATMLVGQVIYPTAYGFLAERRAWAFGVVLLRSGLVVLWLLLVYRRSEGEPAKTLVVPEPQSIRR